MQAVPILVENVPSLHVVIDLLSDLLQSQRRDWAVLLASHLLSKYATPKSLSIARSIFQSLQASAAPRQTLAFVKDNIEALRRLIAAFPVLLDEFVELSEKLRDDSVWEKIVSVF